MRERRKKIWIDRFQRSLSVRIALYFILYQVAVWSCIVIERNLLVPLEALLGGALATYCFAFLAAAVVFLGLLFIYDAVTFSHRIVGPIYRFRKTVEAIAAGEELELVRLRKGDFLQELGDE